MFFEIAKVAIVLVGPFNCTLSKLIGPEQTDLSSMRIFIRRMLVVEGTQLDRLADGRGM